MSKPARIAILVGVVAAVALLAVLTINTARFSSRQIAAPACPGTVAEVEPALRRLADLVRLQTISPQPPALMEAAPFLAAHALLERNFPRVHQALTREIIGDYSLLYTWRGRDPGAQPILLLAHLDVVPVDPGSENRWTQPPFAGQTAQGFLIGRGTLDNKAVLSAILEAVEALLAEGYQPRRTVYLAFGHDEELGGARGNGAIARQLAAARVRLESVLDEGPAVMHDMVPNIAQPVALVGVAEKGYLSVELSVQGEGGHSSMPPVSTSVEILGAAVARVGAARYPAVLSAPLRQQFAWLGPEMKLVNRLALANLWLFAPLVQRQLSATLAGDALLRTTVAPTMLNGSAKENVLPTHVSAVVNFRLLPGTSGAEVIRRTRAVVNDRRVNVSVRGAQMEASRISSTQSRAFDALHRSIRQSFSDVLVAPTLLMTATDSRHYQDIAQNIYRFQPARLRRDDLARIHGSEERIAQSNFAEYLRFYACYLRNASGG